MVPKERDNYFKHEIASVKTGAIFSLEKPIFITNKPEIISVSDYEYLIPLNFGINFKDRTFHILPLRIIVPTWIEDPTTPQFIRLQKFAETLLVNTDHQGNKITFKLLPTKESLLELLFRFLSPSANKTFQQNLLELAINQPKKLKSALNTAPFLPEDSTDDFHFFHPETDSRIDMNGESELSSSRQALLLLALLTDDPNSGPEQLLRVLHKDPNIVGKNKGKNRNKDNFLDYLVDKTVQLDQMQFNADVQSSEIKEELNDKEIVSKIGDTTAQNIVSFAKIRRSNLENSDSQTNKTLQDAEAKMKQNRQILGQQRYVVPTEDKEIEKNQKTKNNELSESLRKQLQILRSKDEISDQNSEDVIFALLQFQKGKFSTSKKEIDNNLSELLKKDVSELTHEEIAITLSFEMEILTRVNDEKEKTNSLEEKVLQLAEKIHKLGLYFINAKLSNVHDPLMLHMSGVNFCLVHTPPQLQMLSSLSTSMQNIATSLQVVQVTTIPTGISFGSGVSLFAQALVFGGANWGAVFLSGGERSSGVISDGSAFKPKSPETPRKKTKPQVIFQSPGGGSLGKSESRSEQKATPPVTSKPNEHIVKALGVKKIEKLKFASTQAPSRPKNRGIPIYVARHSSASTVSRPVAKEKKTTPPIVTKPKVERVPRIVIQPRILIRSGSEQKASFSTSGGSSRKEPIVRSSTQGGRRVSEIPIATTTASFSKRLEQVFQAKPEQKATNKATESKANYSQSKVASTSRQQTELHRKQKQAKEIRKNEQVQSQSKIKTKTSTVPARQELQGNSVKKVRSIKETKHVPAISSRKKTKAEQIKPIETKRQAKKKSVLSPEAEATVQQIQAKANISMPKTTPENKDAINRKQVKEVRATRGQPALTEPVEVPDEATGENLVTITVALVGGALFKSTKSIIPSQNRDVATQTTETIEATENFSTQDTESNLVNTFMARKHAEYGRGRGGGSSKMKAKNKVAIKKTDKVLTATMRSLPTNAMIDVSDSFNTAREVKMWAHEALTHPKLIERYYATSA